MSDNGTNGMPPGTEQLQAEIERTREDLAETVDELAAKLDVKARAHDKIDQAKHQAADQLHRLGNAATDASGRPRRPLYGVASGVLVAMMVVVVIQWRRGNR
ncbi:DUF3618 domain-containing protein [Nocardioides sp. AN3]